MKPWFLLVVAACSREHDAPGQAPVRVESRHSIDVTVTAGTPLSIRGVELTPSPREPGVLTLGYRIDARDPGAAVPARILCRVGGYNVVYPTTDEDKLPGRRLATLFRPDPFAEPVQACEVTFFRGDAAIASACYQAGVLADGACPKDTFTLPPHATKFSVELTRAALELRHGTAIVSGLFTVFEPLAAGRRFATQLRCEDPAGTASGEGELAFLPLDRLPAGASMYGPVAIFLDRTPAETASCELRVISRATTGSPTEQIHAQYCLTTHAFGPGDCSQK